MLFSLLENTFNLIKLTERTEFIVARSSADDDDDDIDVVVVDNDNEHHSECDSKKFAVMGPTHMHISHFDIQSTFQNIILDANFVYNFNIWMKIIQRADIIWWQYLETIFYLNWAPIILILFIFLNGTMFVSYTLRRKRSLWLWTHRHKHRVHTCVCVCVYDCVGCMLLLCQVISIS